jgi:hypothetical protein
MLLFGFNSRCSAYALPEISIRCQLDKGLAQCLFITGWYNPASSPMLYHRRLTAG